jgi:hypothetical protein
MMSNIWVVKDAEGVVTNPSILASEEFMAANFDFYESLTPDEPVISEEAIIPVYTAAQIARIWRDSELSSTDFMVPTTDHPEHAAYITYRAALRDWPSTSDFPDTKPVLGS